MLLRVQLVSAAPTAAVPVGNFVKKFDYDQQLSFLPNLFLIPSHDGTRFMSIFFHYLSYQTVLGQWQKWAFNPRDLSTSTHKSTLPKKSPSIPFNGALITLCPSNPSDSFFIPFKEKSWDFLWGNWHWLWFQLIANDWWKLKLYTLSKRILNLLWYSSWFIWLFLVVKWMA